MTDVSISKSVARAFALLELFRTERRAMTAAEIQRALGAPQPSIRALLKNLTDLGYLHFTATDRTYIPSVRVPALGDWIRRGGSAAVALTQAVDAIARGAEETTSLSTLRGRNLEVLYVRKADHAVAVQLEPGVGAPLWRSAVGRLLLARCPPQLRSELFAETLATERDGGLRRQIMGARTAVERLVRVDACTGYDILIEGVGAICVAASTDAAGQPLVVAVAGVSQRLKSREREILKLMRAELHRAGRSVGRDALRPRH